MKSICTALSTSILLLTTALAVDFSYSFKHTGSSPRTLVFADVNLDGFPDLVVADHNRFLSVLLVSSTGQFTINSNVSLASDPVRVVAADYDNDGIPDIAVLETDRFQVFTSTGSGTLLFRTEREFAAGVVGGEMVTLDFNRDHFPDLILTRCDPTTCHLDTYMNTVHPPPSNTFTRSSERFIASPAVDALVAADFNRDGWDEVAFQDGRVIRIERNEQSEFGFMFIAQTISPPAGSTGLGGLAVGDIDATRGPDLIVQAFNSCGSGCVHSTDRVYLNNGSGTLSFKGSVDMGNNSAGKSLLVDITGDNRLDLVHINSNPVSGRIEYARYKGSGAFDSIVRLISFNNPTDFAARDFNLDGRHDPLSILPPSSPATSPPRSSAHHPSRPHLRRRSVHPHPLPEPEPSPCVAPALHPPASAASNSGSTASNVTIHRTTNSRGPSPSQPEPIASSSRLSTTSGTPPKSFAPSLSPNARQKGRSSGSVLRLYAV
jgi:hypothetical protein